MTQLETQHNLLQFQFIQACEHTDLWAAQNKQLTAGRDDGINKLAAWQAWWNDYEVPATGTAKTAQAEHFDIHSNTEPTAEEQRQANDAVLYAKAAAAKAQSKAGGPPLGVPNLAPPPPVGQAECPQRRRWAHPRGRRPQSWHPGSAPRERYRRARPS